MTITDMAKAYLAAADQVKDLDHQAKAAKQERDDLEAALVDAMLDEELQSLKVQGRLLSLRQQIHVTPDMTKEEQLFGALEAHGLGSMIKRTVNRNTLTAAVKEQMAFNGGELPAWLDGAVNIFEQPKIIARKG